MGAACVENAMSNVLTNDDKNVLGSTVRLCIEVHTSATAFSDQMLCFRGILHGIQQKLQNKTFELCTQISQDQSSSGYHNGNRHKVFHLYLQYINARAIHDAYQHLSQDFVEERINGDIVRHFLISTRNEARNLYSTFLTSCLNFSRLVRCVSVVTNVHFIY